MKKKIDNIKSQMNYSKAGKVSTYFYSYIFHINSQTNKKLLKFKKRKKLYNDILKDDISSPNEDETDPYFQDNIFDKDYKPKIIINKNKKNKKYAIKSSCSYLNKIKSKESEIMKIRRDLMSNNYNKSFNKYKHHLLHHNELENDSIEKKKAQPSCTRYFPKLDFVNKKIIYSIPFIKMSGRKPTILIKKIKKINDNIKKPKTCDNNNYKAHSSRIEFKVTNNKTFNTFDDEKNQIISQSNSTLFDFRLKKEKNKNELYAEYSPLKNRLSTSLSLNSLTKRKSHSVLNSKNIIEKINENDKSKATNSKSKIQKDKFIMNVINKKIQMNNDKYMIKNKDRANLTSYRSSLKNINNNKINFKNNKSNMCGSRSCLNLKSAKLQKEYKGINFGKMLSREYLNKLNKHKDDIKTILTPNYSAIQQNNIMNVLYVKKDQVNKPKPFIGYNEDFTYDINKVYNKYNNHSSPRVFNIKKMTGRERDGNNSPLPTFMLRMYDRNSIDSLNETSLKMNNYINGSFKDIQSSFNDKKSFNTKFQVEELKRNNIFEERNIRKIINRKIKMELDKDKNINSNIKMSKNNFSDRTEEKYFNKTNGNKSWKNLLGEFYKINYDNLEESLIGGKIDGITLKSYKDSKY